MMRYLRKKIDKKLEKKNSRFLNHSQFSLQIWAKWGCLRGAQFLVNNFLKYKNKHVVRQIWHIHMRVRYLKLVKLFLTCVFLPLKSFEPLKSSNFLRLFFYKKLAKLAVWRDFFRTSTSKHPKDYYICREFIFVQESTICFNEK